MAKSPMRTGFVTFFVLVLFLSPVCEAHADERADLTKAVEAYFEAEIAGNWTVVWKLLAPSSEFKKHYTYEMYLEMVRAQGVRVKSYNILEIEGIHSNPDPGNLPAVEKMALVRVSVKLTAEGGRDSEHVSTLTFLKEGGQWYKG